jgi:ABC-type bacteriocin/lantibiotic exporter with double-glycine peptidase domain
MMAATLVAGCGHASRGPSPADVRTSKDWVVAPHVELIPQRGENDCGPAALDIMLTRWGARTSAVRIGQEQVAGVPDQGGVTAGELRNEARQLGFESFVFRGGFDDLSLELGGGRPVLVGLVREDRGKRSAHFVVVVGHDRGQAQWLVADPAEGWQVMPVDELRRQWSAADWVTLVLFPSKAETSTAGALRSSSL